MNSLISLALLSLFLPLKMSAGPVQLRPFDLMVVVLCAMTAVIAPRLPTRPRPVAGFYLFGAYAAWHAISAFLVSSENGIRELLQVTIILAFGGCVIALLPVLNLKRIGMFLLVGMAAVTAWSVVWHLQHGFLTGWKRLDDPKTTFTFLPTALGCALLFADRSRKRLYIGLWALLGVIILLSGERKALGIYVLITAAFLAKGRFSPAPILLVGAAAAASISLLAASNAYMATQLQSFIDPFDSRNSFDAVVRGGTPQSFSNSQRLFAVNLSKQLIAESPIIGTGTNGYTDRLAREFYYVPTFLRVNIHGEPLRVLVENGLVGLLLYLSFWIVSIRANLKSCRQLVYVWRLPRDSAFILLAVLVAPLVFYALFEGSGTHMFIVGLLVTLYPALINEVAVRRRSSSAGVAPAGNTQRVPVPRRPQLGYR
ncbi:O-antigen ligase family protein [Brevundimonas sp.]|uniref:O-antigen ligase family protein n=1 Tax=Brevundimonas sp. TaxID=1871086 RepID=UPI003D0D6C84